MYCTEQERKIKESNSLLNVSTKERCIQNETTITNFWHLEYDNLLIENRIFIEKRISTAWVTHFRCCSDSFFNENILVRKIY